MRLAAYAATPAEADQLHRLAEAVRDGAVTYEDARDCVLALRREQQQRRAA